MSHSAECLFRTEERGIGGNRPEDHLLGPAGSVEPTHETFSFYVSADRTGGLATAEGDDLVGRVRGTRADYSSDAPQSGT
jgi:hypothetical protein